MKILITGGAGFIGYHLAKYLLIQDNIEIVLVDNLFKFKEKTKDGHIKSLLKDNRVKFLNLDLTDQSVYKNLGSNYDHVYHLAAVNGTKNFYEMPHEVLRINTLTLIYMLDWFRKESSKGKFCFTSSNEAYAGGLNAFGKLPIPTPEKVPLVIDDPYNARWSYGSTKLIGELFVIHYAKMYDFRALIVRPHNFYGPREGYGHVIPDLLMKIADKQEPLEIFGKDETRTFCYIDDAVKAMSMLMDTNKTDNQPIETVHIGNTDEITIENLAKKIFVITGWTPREIDFKSGLKGSVKRRLADISKIKKLVGWKPETSLDDGLKKTYQWYYEN